MTRLSLLIVSLALASLTGPALAAPCLLPDSKDPVERALCAHPDLAQLDLEARKAEGDVSERRQQPERRNMWNVHHNWLQDRIRLCPKADVTCLRTIYERQIRFWTGVDGTGPDSQGRLTFFHLSYYRAESKKAPEQGSFRAHFIGYRFADPRTGAQKLFNRDVEAARVEVEKAVQNDADPGVRSAVEAYYETKVHAPYQAGNFLSARVTNDEFTGGAHGSNSTWNLNLDVTAARKLKLSDLFAAPTLTRLMSACAGSIAADMTKARMPVADELYRPDRRTPSKAFSELFLRANRWTFTPFGAQVTFPQYALGGMALGEPDCRISRDALAKATMRGLVLSQ